VKTPEELYEELAQVATDLAELAVSCASIYHTALAGVPGARAEAERQYRYAIASWAAAEAYRNYEMPSRAIRQALSANASRIRPMP
jgi:hypothetical protein